MKTMKTLIIEEAVLDTVNTFLDADETFSIFDITQKIRQNAESGEIELPFLRVSGQPFEFDIPHIVVKDVFLTYLNQDAFNQPLSRSWNGQYFVYEGLVSRAANNAVNVAPVTGLSPFPSSTGNTRLPDNTVTDRIITYLSNCKSKGISPTIKQVQSAIKRGNEQVGWTCADLQPVVQKIASNI